MASPQFKNAGGIAAGTSTSIYIAYPSGISAGDILIMLLLGKTSDSFVEPDDWHIIDTVSSAGMFTCVMWKRATGSEAGNLLVSSNSSGGTLIAGVMQCFSDCKGNSLPYEGIETNGITNSQTAVVPSVTTTDIDRLVVAGIFLNNEYGLSSITDYVNDLVQSTPLGGGCLLSSYSQEVAVAGSTTQRNATINPASCDWGVIAFALLPTVPTHAFTVNSIIAASVVGESAIAQTHELGANNIEPENVIITPVVPGYVYGANSIESGNVIITLPVIAHIHDLAAINIESESVVIDEVNLSHYLIAQVITLGNPVVDEVIIDLLQSASIISDNPIIGQAGIGQVNILNAQNIESGVVITSVNLSKYFASYLFDLMNGNSDVNGLVDGIYYSILPDNPGTDSMLILYDFALIDSINVIGRNNVMDIYTLTIIILASDTFAIDSLVNHLRNYLDNYSSDNFPSIVLESSGQEPEGEKELFKHELNYKIHFKS